MSPKSRAGDFHPGCLRGALWFDFWEVATDAHGQLRLRNPEHDAHVVVFGVDDEP